MAEFYRKKKICQLCAGKTINYKDVAILSKYINEKFYYQKQQRFLAIWNG